MDHTCLIPQNKLLTLHITLILLSYFSLLLYSVQHHPKKELRKVWNNFGWELFCNLKYITKKTAIRSRGYEQRQWKWLIWRFFWLILLVFIIVNLGSWSLLLPKYRSLLEGGFRDQINNPTLALIQNRLRQFLS